MKPTSTKLFKILVILTMILSGIFLVFTAVFLPLVLLGIINSGLWYPILTGIIAFVNLVLGVSCIVVYKLID